MGTLVVIFGYIYGTAVVRFAMRVLYDVDQLILKNISPTILYTNNQLCIIIFRSIWSVVSFTRLETSKLTYINGSTPVANVCVLIYACYFVK